MPCPKELSVITKTYDFLLWLIPMLDKFPRSRKFTLGDRIETNASDVLTMLIEAKFSRNKQTSLQKVNLLIEQLRFSLRLAKDLRCLSTKRYGHAAQLVNDIGTEVGAWLKQQRKP